METEDFVDIEDADHAILAASRYGDIDVLREAIAAEGNVNFIDDHGNSALHYGMTG